MKITIKALEKFCIIALDGNLDLHNASRLEAWVKRLLTDGAPALIIDGSKIAFIDSTGLDCLLDSFASARRRNVPFHVACLPGEVRRIREIERLKNCLPLAASVESALKTG